MTHRERALAVLNYQPYDRLPLVHFGYWNELYAKWRDEGRFKGLAVEANGLPSEHTLSRALGFDCGWGGGLCFNPGIGLRPGFGWKVVKELPDGSKHVQTWNGVTVLQKPDAGSIPSEISHLLVDRASWEEHYRWRYEWTPTRVTESSAEVDGVSRRYDQGGRELMLRADRQEPLGLFCGSMYGHFRDIAGLEGSSYLLVDDEPLVDEILDLIADQAYRCVEAALATGVTFDYAHFWEDICFKNGPLVNPAMFAAKVGPHYRRIVDLLNRHGIRIVSLDCDGCIDALLPIWLENGVNTMFPIEVGTWRAELAPWRKTHGRDLRGVGGMNKVVFAFDRAAVDAEIERLKPLVELGGFIPCPDHRIPPDAKWDLVRYYTDRMRAVFG